MTLFSKTFKVKTNSQLKGSERKKLRFEILKNFPQLKEEDVLSIIPNKEAASVVKVFTHSKDLVMVYFAVNNPVVFEYEGVLFPTVYLLWQFPELLYCFTTWPQVFPKLAGGADLMLPGVILQGEFNAKSYGNLQKGERVAINTTTNLAPVAVGTTYLSSTDMFLCGKRGKAVRVLHFLGDDLWAQGTKTAVPNLGPPNGFACEKEEEEHDSLQKDNLVSQISEIVIDSPKADSSCSSETEKADDEFSITNTNTLMDEVCEEASEQSEKDSDEKELMDELIMYCFLKALKTTAKKAEYPMLASTFCKQHLLPACPPGKTLDVKKTSYKKLSKFLVEMDAINIIKVKELTKGVQRIMSIDLSHPRFREFVYAEEDNCTSQPETKDQGGKGSPEIKEMYVVTAAVLPLFRHFGYVKGTSLPVSLLRKHITDYVKEENLQSTSDRRMVNLDATLRKVTNTTDDTLALNWEELITKTMSRMTHSYQCTISGKAPVVNKGKLEPITIHVAKRTGNKKVTLIDNLELYGVVMQDFSRECQHGVAASTSISSVPGKKSQQLMVQGDQTIFVEKLLRTKYEIPKRYILAGN
ncbi:eukaryotic translation initiation factor 2D [Schistocerca gregaria]|uniref:eukaryotic translation initiation factor 2D n=1 Tax=Schistocerca gregaria TaxID=7010 RepID=UPI00211F1A9D|nr:eukaryotic translation initiation factor 2D [Schistocerca gregaria]